MSLLFLNNANGQVNSREPDPTVQVEPTSRCPAGTTDINGECIIGNLAPHSIKTLTSVTDKNLKVVYVDLGTKGESTLILYPNGRTLLIDGGMASSYSKLESILKKYSVTDIDVMVGTHADEDHIAGLSKLLDDTDFKVHKILVSDVQSDTKTYNEFITIITKIGLEPEAVFDGYDFEIDKTVPTVIISPSPNGLDDGRDATLSNTNSLVVLLEYNNVSFLFNSDASYLTEKYIVTNHNIDINIMNSPHHGSKFSSTDRFLNMVSPELIIVSANNNNQYGHPDTSVITEYNSRGIKHYQTGVDGTTTIKTDGVGCSIMFDNKPDEPCYSGIHMVLDYTGSDIPFCKNSDLNRGISSDTCSGRLHIVKNGYYNYKTGEVNSIIDPYGDTSIGSSSKGLSRSIWVVSEWVLVLQDWYDQGLITPDNFDDALQYLIDEKIAIYQKI